MSARPTLRGWVDWWAAYVPLQHAAELYQHGLVPPLMHALSRLSEFTQKDSVALRMLGTTLCCWLLIQGRRYIYELW